MKLAVQGCCHGALDEIYHHIQTIETQNNYKITALLICGDFQAVRNHRDLQCMAVPPKYRQLGNFYKYYTGEKIAPLLTIVIGGNHEASNYFWELYHGGWLAPNIYFLGHSGCVQVNGLRIAGASGIFKKQDFQRGHHEHIPYDHSSMRSIYHIREFNVRRLSLLSPPHIFLSHDWPQSIELYGDVRTLLRRKPFFKNDINTGNLGSPPLMDLLRTLKPAWWFSAHLHVRFEAVYKHGCSGGQQVMGEGQIETTPVDNPDEIAIDLDEEEPSSVSPRNNNPDEIILNDEDDIVPTLSTISAPQPLNSFTSRRSSELFETRFLALDKCLPRRQFLEVIDIHAPLDPSLPSTSVTSSSFPDAASTATCTFTGDRPILSDNHAPQLAFDPEWLAITRAFNPYFTRTYEQVAYPDEEAARAKVGEAMRWVQENLMKRRWSSGNPNMGGEHAVQSGEGLRLGEGCERPGSSSAGEVFLPSLVAEHQVFSKTAPGPGTEEGYKFKQPPPYTNPQTVAFCKMLGIEDKINPTT